MTEANGIVVGVDIGGTKTALMACDVAQGEEIARDRFPTPTDAGPEAFLAALVEAVDALVEGGGRKRGDLRALGLAVPGQVDVGDGRVIKAGNLKGWTDIPLRDLMRDRLGVPVWVDQDANGAALGERWRGAAKQMHNFVFLALGTGVGAGVVVNGRLRRGYHNAAGEVGNSIMGREYLGRDRKGHGNLELLVGGRTIRRRAHRATGKELSAADVFAGADRDPKLAAIADRVADYLAITVVNIAALLDPQAIVFGGGTAAAGSALIERVRCRVERELRHCPALIHSTLGEDAQLHGAVFGALWQLDPELALREELR